MLLIRFPMGWNIKQKKYHTLISRLRRVMIRPEDRGQRETLLYWQQSIFVSLLLSILILGLPAAVSGSIQFRREGNSSMAVAILFYYLLFFGLAFFRSIRYWLRLMLLGWALYIIGITLLISTGPYGAGLVYLSVSYVHFSLHLSRKRGLLYAIFNGLVFSILTILESNGHLSQFRIAEYGESWWIIAINMILVHILISQMIGIILHGIERSFQKEKMTNKTLRHIKDNNAKRIRLLQSIRQVGNCLSDNRLELSEKLQIMQEGLHTELPVQSSAISLMDRESNESAYVSSIPKELRGISIRLPSYKGPFLMLKTQEEKDAYPHSKTSLMKQAGKGTIYFGSHFYTSDQKGFLELLLRRKPDSVELEYLQMNLFHLSGAIINEQLFQQLEDSKNLLENSYDEILSSWARMMELRDIEIKGHNERVVNISLQLAELLNLSGENTIHLRRGVFLHDIGKLGIPDSILHKTTSLSQIEWDIIRKHPQIGRDSVINIPFLHLAIPVIYSHHEKWNGRGYPEGLKGEEIPILARIFTIADVYDAMTSDRPYRRALVKKDVLSFLQSQKGQVFDPEILEIFLKNIDAITGTDSTETEGGSQKILDPSD